MESHGVERGFMNAASPGVIALFLPLALWVAYSRTAFTIAYIAVLALAGALMPVAVRRGVRARVERLEFAG
jgi:hypothetical protein